MTEYFKFKIGEDMYTPKILYEKPVRVVLELEQTFKNGSEAVEFINKRWRKEYENKRGIGGKEKGDRG